MPPMKAGLLALLFSLALRPAVAAQTAPPPPRHECFRGRPQPACDQFWITEFSLLTRINRLPDGEYLSVPYFMRWELGSMENHGPRSAAGVTLVAELDDLGSRLGVKPRYRRWLGPRAALDLSAGVLFKGSGRFRAPGFVAQAAITGGDYVGFVTQLEYFRSDQGRRDLGAYAGVRFGALPGIIAGLLLPVLVIAASIPET